jgi:hypothetical protein
MAAVESLSYDFSRRTFGGLIGTLSSAVRNSGPLQLVPHKLPSLF